MEMSCEEVTQYWLDFCKRHAVGNELLVKGKAKIQADSEYWADHTMWELLESLAEPGSKRN